MAGDEVGRRCVDRFDGCKTLGPGKLPGVGFGDFRVTHHQRRRPAQGYRDVLASGLIEETTGQAASLAGLAVSQRDPQDLQFRTGQQQRHGKGVVDVRAQVGVQNDLVALGPGRGLKDHGEESETQEGTN